MTLVPDAPATLRGTTTAGAPLGARPPGMPPLWMVLLFAYAYAFVVALVLQKLVLPIMPGLHAGHGLMSHDAIVFHDMAVAMADRIHASGWSEWRLVPGHGITANVGILAAIYALLGPDPVWFIPLNAGFHALGALLVLQLGLYLLPGRRGWIAGGAAALLFLVFPSALVWYGQNHKDAFLIAGYLLVLVAFVRALGRPALRETVGDLLWMCAGCALVAIMRPHMLMVYTVAFAIALAVTALVQRIGRAGSRLPLVRHGALMLVLITVVSTLAPKDEELVEVLNRSVSVPDEAYAGLIPDGWRWLDSGLLPNAIDQKLEQASLVRAHFIAVGRSIGAGSLLDADRAPQDAWEVAAYLPRALWVGLFAPFPDTWLERPSVPRLIGAIETLVFYLMVPGILILVWRMPSPALCFCLVASAVVIAVLGYTSPNAGTLHRIRYAPLFVFMLAGAAGWTWLLGKLTHALGRPPGLPQGSTTGHPTEQEPPAVMVGAGVSGKRAVGAGVLVTLVSMIGALGLLIRDLLLINRSGFGTSLDSFYLAMMLPMLFVTTLTLPFGDALTAALHRARGRDAVQSLLGAASASSLLLLAPLCLLLFTVSGSVYQGFADGGDLALTLRLMPVALLLLLFSGLAVIGNSLLNSLDRSAEAACAQLVVPVAAIAAILLAPGDEVVMPATVGMAVGQVLNLLVLFLLARRQGFRLVPSSVGWMRRERTLLTSYAWLVGAAFTASLSVPLNYWLAGHFGAGAVSTWAIGSKLVQVTTALSVAMMSSVWVPYFSKLVNASLHLRIRNDLFLSLLVASWGASIVALAVFAFAGPLVLAAMPGAQDGVRVAQLTGVIQLGALQLPILVSGLMLLKFSATTEGSWKAMLATLAGLAANVGLGYGWLPVWGMFGVAAAWGISSLLTTLMIMGTTRSQSFLGWSELFGIAGSWLVLGAFAMAIHFGSPSVTVGAILICVLVLLTQVKTLLGRHSARQVAKG